MQTSFQRHRLPLPASSIFLGVWWPRVRGRQLAPSSPLSQLISLGTGAWRDSGHFMSGNLQKSGAPGSLQSHQCRLNVSGSQPLGLDLLKSWGPKSCPLFTSSSPIWDLGGGTGDPNPGSHRVPLFHPSLSQCSRPFLGEQGREATVCKPRGSFFILF